MRNLGLWLKTQFLQGPVFCKVPGLRRPKEKEDVIRFYHSWFTGQEKIEYTMRFNQAGKYILPVSRVEAMYSPDLFAELPEGSWTVQE